MVSRLVCLLDCSPAARVHVMCDFHQVTDYPREVAQLQLSAELWLGHPRQGWLLLYGMSSPLMQVVSSVITQMAGIRAHLSRDEAEALAFLAQQDETLRELIALNNNAQPERN
jgi:hypothetical protein